MQNNFNPYGYQPNMYQQKTNNLIFVNGMEGAKSYQIQPNQMIMLLDSDSPIVYKKTANGYGQAIIEAFELVPIQEHKENDKYVLKTDFDNLVKRIDELTKLAKKFLDDKDAPDGKALKYYLAMKD